MDSISDLLLFAMAGALISGFMYLGETDIAADLAKVVIGAAVMYLKGKG